MLLAPNERFEAPFEWDMSGMLLGPDDDEGLRIENIVANSPAARAGLAVDDRVTHVDGRAVSTEDVIELKELLRRDGTVVTIQATRAGAPLTVTLTLVRLV
jgi:C-terminal processing protease CtpA/Prc